MTSEERRLEDSRDRQAHWKRWGPYVSERAWGTVREDYSADGTVWEYLPHDQARSKAYRWNEDGIAGICDRHQKICFALALWNGRDPILKERLFGLNGNEGNHGEDVKECYYYLDNTPTHSYMKYLYKYPQKAFPYEQLLVENRRRGRGQQEFELTDTGVFDDNRYFDVVVEYAKASVEDIVVRIEVANRGPEAAELHVLPTVWFRNTWSWGRGDPRPELHAALENAIELNEPQYGRRWLLSGGSPELLFTENETNTRRLYGYEGGAQYVKDGINDYVVRGDVDAVNPAQRGTKAAAHYRLTVGAGESVELRLRLTDTAGSGDALGAEYDHVFEERKLEADEFYDMRHSGRPFGGCAECDAAIVRRPAVVEAVLSIRRCGLAEGRPRAAAAAAGAAEAGRNHEWTHLYNADVISMPDKWEYPWYAAWDLAFHCVPLALVDPEFAKEQLDAAAARVVHAPQRAVAGVRVGVWRCESAGACVGGVARLQDREEAARRGRPRVSGARVPEAAAQLHVVGESQGY